MVIKSLSIFFPCRNEAGNIERVVRQALDVMGTLAIDYEIIIVNDGSTDGTGPLADRLALNNHRVRVVHHPVNRGYGGALQSGFRAATKEWVFYTDGDGQFDLNELPPLFELAGPFDIVSGYRLRRQEGFQRRLNAWGWGKLVGWMLGLHIRDVDCAFKLYRREMFGHIEMRSLGALIDAEILAKAQRAGYTITQVGVHHYPRLSGQASGAGFKVIVRAFYELMKLRREILKPPRIIKPPQR